MWQFTAHLHALTEVARSWPTRLAVLACWALLGSRLGCDPALPAYGYLSVAGVLLARSDLRKRRLPDVLTLPAYPLTIALLAAAALLGFGSGSGSWIRALLGGAAMWTVYASIRLAKPVAMGLGDVKLAGPIGIATGWLDWPTWALALTGAFVIAAVVNVPLLVSRRIARATRIPFGPFMLAAALGAVVTDK